MMTDLNNVLIIKVDQTDKIIYWCDYGNMDTNAATNYREMIQRELQSIFPNNVVHILPKDHSISIIKGP